MGVRKPKKENGFTTRPEGATGQMIKKALNFLKTLNEEQLEAYRISVIQEQGKRYSTEGVSL